MSSTKKLPPGIKCSGFSPSTAPPNEQPSPRSLRTYWYNLTGHRWLIFDERYRFAKKVDMMCFLIRGNIRICFAKVNPNRRKFRQAISDNISGSNGIESTT